MKRLIAIVAAFAALLLAAGCGSSSSGSATEDALSFMPKGAPLVGTIDTDPNGAQWQQVNKLLAKFPFAGQIKTQIKQSFNSSTALDFDRDLKPVFGNEAVFAVPTVAALRSSGRSGLFALKASDEEKASAFIQKDATKTGNFEGTDIFKERSSTFLALKDGVIVAAGSLADLQAALKRHAAGPHMTQADLDSSIAGVSGDSLVKVGVNAQQLIGTSSSASAARARKIKWIAALRSVGFSLAAQPDGLQSNLRATTSGGLSPQDLPLSSGAQSAPVVRRASDVGFGLRNVAQVLRFAETAGLATDPKGYGDYRKRKARFGKVLGVDVDRDLVSQLQGNASVSVGLDGGFAVRSALRDPKAFTATLKKIVPRLPKTQKGKHLGVAVPKRPNGFYAVATPKGKRYVFAVIGGRFVLATDPARAAQFATQSATPVPGVKGSFVTALDARAIASQLAAKRGQSAAAVVTGALGEFVGSVESETSGLTGSFKLYVK